MNFEQYLIDNGTPFPEKEAREELRKQYRKAYQKQYGQSRKTNTRTIKVTLASEVYEQIQAHADSLGLKPATYTRKALFAAINQCYVLPDHEVLRDVIIALKDNSGKLNQIAHCMSRNYYIGDELTQARDILLRLEAFLHEKLAPISLVEFLEKEIDANPKFLPALRQILKDYTTNNAH